MRTPSQLHILPFEAPKLFAFDRRHLPFIRLSYAEIGNPAARLRFAPVKCLGRRFPNSHLWIISFAHWSMALDLGLPHSTVRSKAVRSTSIRGPDPHGATNAFEILDSSGCTVCNRLRYLPGLFAASSYGSSSKDMLPDSGVQWTEHGGKSSLASRSSPHTRLLFIMQCVSPANDVSSARETVPP